MPAAGTLGRSAAVLACCLRLPASLPTCQTTLPMRHAHWRRQPHTRYDACRPAAPSPSGAAAPSGAMARLRFMPSVLNSKAPPSLSVPLGPISIDGASSAADRASSSTAPPPPPGLRLCTLAATFRNSLGGMFAVAAAEARAAPAQTAAAASGCLRVSFEQGRRRWGARRSLAGLEREAGDQGTKAGREFMKSQPARHIQAAQPAALCSCPHLQ